MKIVILALCFSLPGVSLAQAVKPATKQQPVRQPTQAPSQLLSLTEVIEVESFSRTVWELKLRYKKEPPKRGEDAVQAIDDFIKNKPEKDERRGLILEHRLFMKHRDSLARLVRYNLKPFVYFNVPVRFALKDGSLTLLLVGVGSTEVYDTLRLTAKARAAKEIQATIFPILKQFDLVSPGDMKYYGVLAVYGSKDSSDDSELSIKPEVVVLVAPVDKTKKFIASAMTEEEFLDAADIYLMDRDTLSGLRKVKVTLE